MALNPKYQKLTELIVGISLAFIIISVFFKEKKNFENLALGEDTVSVNARDSAGQLIHVMQLTSLEYDSLILGWQQRGKKDVILCLGNSQTHGINQLKQGDVNYPKILSDEFQKNSLDVIAHSIPNANLQEHLLLFDFWTSRLPVKYLVIPVFMDDMREDGIRVVEQLNKESYKISNDTSAIAAKINKEIKAWGATETANDMSALNKTVQEKSELFFNSWLDKHFAPWASRPTVRGDLFANLFIWRNTLFGIKATTKRKMILENYNNNLAALVSILDKAKAKNIQVLVYVPPIRHDVEIPYDATEYSNFKNQLMKIATSDKDFHFVNLENVVPGQYWGVKSSTNNSGEKELDFMHFQYAGHKALAENLIPEIKKMLIQ